MEMFLLMGQHQKSAQVHPSLISPVTLPCSPYYHHNLPCTGRWTREEHQLFVKGLELYGKGWKKIACLIKTRTVVQIRTHAQKYFLKLSKARQNGELAGGYGLDGQPLSGMRRVSYCYLSLCLYRHGSLSLCMCLCLLIILLCSVSITHHSSLSHMYLCISRSVVGATVCVHSLSLRSSSHTPTALPWRWRMSKTLYTAFFPHRYPLKVM